MEERENAALQAFLQRDPWLEARKRTQRERGSLRVRATAALINLVRRPAPILGFGTTESLTMTDLNKYRPEVDVELLIDQGVRLFGLRVIGPTRWVYAHWDYEVDPTFVMYYERIRAHAKKRGVVVWILGYGVHCAWSNEEANYQGIDPQLKLLKEATRNHICDLYSWDDEVAVCWKDNKETTITANNLVRSISTLMEQTLVEMERNADGSFKIPVHYSANWFMQRYARGQYQVWLDGAGKDPANRRFLTWRAWLPVIISQPFPTIREVFDKFITPTGTQENAYLRMGSEPAADLWQGTFTAKGPWESRSGIDASIGYGLSRTPAEFARNANLAPTLPPDDGEEEPPPEDAGKYLTIERFNRWVSEQQLTGIPTEE